MNKTTLVIVIGLVILVGGYFLLRGGYRQPKVSAPLPQQQTSEMTPPQIATPSGLIIPIRNHKITQPSITIPAGTTVTWNNEDDLAGYPYSAHTITSGTIDPSGARGQKGVLPNSGSGISDGKFALALQSGQSKSFTFTEAGTYSYYIAEHPLVSGEGRITVEGTREQEPISMSAGTFFFNPKTLNAKVGEEVSLEIAAAGQHTFTVDELGVNIPLPNGKTTRVEFTPTQSGTFTYYCAIPGHREAGQIGTLKVE